MNDAELFCVTNQTNWIASGTSGSMQIPVLWRPPTSPQKPTTTSLASSGTVAGHASLRAYASLFDVATAATGAMYIIAFNAGEQSMQHQWAADSFPALIESAVVESPWTKHIIALRNDLGLAVGALVEALGVSRQTYYDWLRGEIPNPNNQRRIAALAAIGTAWVTFDRGPMNRYWQLPTQPGIVGLREFLISQTISVEQFRTVLTNLGLGRRVLPPRTTKPRTVTNDAHSRRYGSRKAWHVEPKESD